MQIYPRLFKLLSTGIAEPILVRQQSKANVATSLNEYKLYCQSGVSRTLDARARIGFALPV